MSSRWINKHQDGHSINEAPLTESEEQSGYVSQVNRALATDWLSERCRELDTHTNPTLIQNILSALRLNTLRVTEPGLRTWLEQTTSTPQDLRPLLENLQRFILKNEPLCQLTAYIARNTWISEEEWLRNRQMLSQQSHVLFLMEGLTISMANSDTALQEVYQHFIDKRVSFMFIWQDFLNFKWQDEHHLMPNVIRGIKAQARMSQHTGIIANGPI